MSELIKADPAPAERAPARFLRIEFTGSGSEYFRIWIVNLLLTIVTLSLYLPFAKARRLKYFYANTVVDGQALGFHGNPWRMFRGYVLLAALMLAYGIAGRFSPTAGVLAFAVLCAIWPALWRASLHFRLSNTSWRGLRMRFRGDLASAYKAVLPTYLPAIVFVVAQTLLGPREGGGPAQQDLVQAAWLGGIMLIGMLAMLLLFPLGLAMIKRYQHGGYSYAAQQTRLEVPTRRFYGLGLKAVLLTLLPAALLGLLTAVLLPVLKAGGMQGPGLVLAAIALLLVYLLSFVLIGPYVATRLQNLVWNGTRSAELSFESKLGFRALAWLTIKNLLLTLVTLGLYRPFAAVNTARLRLEAVSLRLDGDIDAWLARQEAADQDATGEAAGDFFGIDMGL